ncbi:MAG TPA: hypothetical protein VLL75_09535 [Vicinamibacteria bacterium]|nr:hypothetical protein [Vicinamibacteria bacterium]
MIPKRSLAVLALSAFACGPLAPVRAQDAAASDPEVEAGVRQVQEGDFETAVTTLESASRRLVRDAGSPYLRVRATLHLGFAYVALDQRESAKARFKDALALDPGLRLTTERYSPKVVAVFEEARRERQAETPAAPRRRRSRVPWVVGGAAVVGGGAVLATRGGESGGTTIFSGARFATPVLDCPDGDVGTPLSVAVLLQARNDSKQAATISGVTATLVIVTSALPGEIGFASSRPAMVQPATVPAGGTATVRVDTTLLCQNGAGDAPRFNEWSGRITLTTAAGAFNLETADRMRVNIP